ncbi:MAG: hypothetical protein KGI57_07690, partial [Hyphomicrobiales bacterium]|nr:hypothetical protein [Hyphomicrobiales bacterium]MDE2017570.1 hypothetical protein [Hyphomicrobiales bacterium]
GDGAPPFRRLLRIHGPSYYYGFGHDAFDRLSKIGIAGGEQSQEFRDGPDIRRSDWICTFADRPLTPVGTAQTPSVCPDNFGRLEAVKSSPAGLSGVIRRRLWKALSGHRDFRCASMDIDPMRCASRPCGGETDP